MVQLLRYSQHGRRRKLLCLFSLLTYGSSESKLYTSTSPRISHFHHLRVSLRPVCFNSISLPRLRPSQARSSFLGHHPDSTGPPVDLTDYTKRKNTLTSCGASTWIRISSQLDLTICARVVRRDSERSIPSHPKGRIGMSQASSYRMDPSSSRVFRRQSRWSCRRGHLEVTPS